MGKNVTIVQIAKECGVSVATVSRVLNGTVMHSSLYYKAFNVFNPFL